MGGCREEGGYTVNRREKGGKYRKREEGGWRM
jgi:hypothetical protein